jgi:PAS domain S-box-containing protein
MSDIESTPINLLLVDDQPENLVALKAILNNPEYHLFTATSGAEALQIALREKLTVILLDMVLPEMDGCEVAHHLKQVSRTRNVPILFLTAVATDVQQIYRAYEVGAVDYLIKPLDTEVVRKKVAVFVDLVRQREEIERQALLLREAERRDYQLRLAELRLAGDRRYRKLVEGIDHAIAWTANDALRLTFVSRQAPRILGYPMDQFLAPDFWDKHLHPDDRDSVLAVFRRALTECVDLVVDHRMVTEHAQVLWFHTGISGESERGDPPELHGISLDVTDIKRAEETQTFLADVGAVLSESLDYRTTLANLARRVVPYLANWCLIDEVFGSSTVREVAAAHADPAQEVWVRGLERRHALECGNSPGIADVVRTGRSKLCRHIPDMSWMAGEIGAGQTELLRRIGAVSCMFVPLSVRDRVLGVMTLVSSAPHRRFSPTDLAFAEEVCRRAALAMENALLYAESERASRAREEFLAIVSHDLRSPLSSVIASGRMLERVPGNAEQAERAARTIQRSAARMERLITDLLDLVQIQAGRLIVEPEAYDALSVIDDSLEMFKPIAAEKEIHLHVEGTANLQLYCDRDRVLQILSNLVGNAFKFTPPAGSIVVRVEPDGHEVRFTISDTGPGIPEEQFAHIWERFWRARTANASGVGLGLSIAKGLVEAHGGRIWGESTVGVGTTIYFTLPLVAEGMTTNAMG